MLIKNRHTGGFVLNLMVIINSNSFVAYGLILKMLITEMERERCRNGEFWAKENRRSGSLGDMSRQNSDFGIEDLLIKENISLPD